MEPIVLYPSQRGLLPVLTELSGSTTSRRVFLSTQKGEDVWWTAESVNFVIDTGVQLKMVDYYFLQEASSLKETSADIFQYFVLSFFCRFTIQE